MTYQSVKATAFSLLNNNLSKQNTTALKRQSTEHSNTPVNSAQSPLMSWQNWKQLRAGRLPGQVIIQLTDQCNASCSQCGMRRESKFTRSTLSVDDIKRMLDAMAERGVTAVSFTGGEPLLYLKQLEECIRHARSLGIPYIRTGTNGFMFRNHERPEFQKKVHELAETLADSGLYTFWMSIDSASAEIHEKNRGLANSIAGIEKALPIFHEHGLYPSSNLGINRYLGGATKAPDINAEDGPEAFYQHFRESFRQFYSFVEGLGFTIVNACYPMDMDNAEADAVYTATSSDDFIQFTKAEKLQLFRAMFDTIPEFRHRLRIFTPLTSLRALIRNYGGETDDSYACRGGIDFFFIDSRDMNTYPCGFRGKENLGKFWDLDLNKLDKQAWCKQCDWECFRDPSELSGPLLDLAWQPFKTMQRFARDRDYSKIWYEDMRYYRACHYFNATTPPDYHRLAAFRAS